MVVDQVSAEGKEYYVTESDACPIGFSVDLLTDIRGIDGAAGRAACDDFNDGCGYRRK